MEESVTNGIGGEVKSKLTKMKIGLKLKEDHRIYYYLIPVEVILENYQDIPPILGRRGFFDKFTITFIEADKRIKIKKHKKYQH